MLWSLGFQAQTLGLWPLVNRDMMEVLSISDESNM